MERKVLTNAEKRVYFNQKSTRTKVLEEIMSENFIPAYDLESLNEEQKQTYLKAVCRYMGVPDDLNLVALTRIDDGEGPARLVAYAKRGATENVRNNLGINVTGMTSQVINGSIVFTVTGVNAKGRQEISTGSKYIEGATGKYLDDGIMTAQTRATRRMTLQFVGAGVLDESEIHSGKTVVTSAAASGLALAATQPTVQPSSAPGKDITPPPVIDAVQATIDGSMTIAKIAEAVLPAEDFSTAQAKLREEAIAQLNAKAEVRAEKKTRKPRGPNKKTAVDLGPSEPVVQIPPIEGVSLQSVAAPLPTPTAPFPPIPLPQPAPVPVGKPRLSPEQVKPYRQRLFRIVNDHLEPNGFTPKEGMGNADKMRAFAGILFPEVANMNELTIEQWEKYLSLLEGKITSEGASAVVKYIEESIGI
jgi:hypothetical protein